jgi:CCR4-NOT transcription complex subunit 9
MALIWYVLTSTLKATTLTCLGVMTSLLQEIISVYRLLNPSQLTAAASNRVCNVLVLLQCIASHNETRALFLHGKITCTPFEEDFF